MSFYKILASDLDGTLLNTKGEISRENLEAIRSLHGMGVSFVPATGRAYNEIPAPLKENPYIRYFICSSGAALFALVACGKCRGVSEVQKLIKYAEE